jgi:hypothetical protein
MDFWPIIKPFITNKGSHFTKNIILCEKDEIINDQNMVAECFNDFFINVAKDIGNVTVVDKNHRPFNLKGGLWFFVSFRNFFSDNTRVRIFFFIGQSANFFSRI